MTKLYGVPLSPYCRKVQLAFAVRGISYELVPTVPGSDEPEFVAASPLKKIPAIETNSGAKFADSTVILSYFERKQTENSLYPANDDDLARALMIEEFADTKLAEVCSALYFQLILSPTIYGKPADEARVIELKTTLIPAQLVLFESLLPESGWVINNQYSVADVAIGAQLIGLWHADFAFDSTQLPKLAAFYQAFLARHEVQAQLAQEKAALANFANKG